MQFRKIKQVDFCSAAELPEKIGVGEEELLAIEDRKFTCEQDALEACHGIADAPRYILAQAMVPKLPAEAVKAIEKFRASLPAMKEKLTTLLQLDPVTGEETWLTTIQAEVIARTKKIQCPTKPCSNCESRIAIAYIEGYLCPVCKTFPFMETETDKKVITTKAERIQNLRSNIMEADQKVAAMEREAMEASDEFKRVWLAFERFEGQVADPLPQSSPVLAAEPGEEELPELEASPDDIPGSNFETDPDHGSSQDEAEEVGAGAVEG